MERIFQDFDGTIGQSVNDSYVFQNQGGFQSIGFYCSPPTSGTVVFEGSYDGTNFDTSLMRRTDSDAYVNLTSSAGFFIGSIANFRTFRVRTSVGGSAPGSVGGRAHQILNTLEGIEHGPAPHRFGENIIHKDIRASTAQTATVIWTPASGKKFVVTDLFVVVSGTVDAQVDIFDETNAQNNRVLSGFLDVSINTPLVLPANFRAPYVSKTANNSLRVSTSAAINIDVSVQGYEIF